MILTTGRRKEAVAKIFLKPGTGQIIVNGRVMENYFPRLSLQKMVREPLVLTQTVQKFSCIARVNGGGIRSQSEAIRAGIARALVKIDPDLRKTLKPMGYLKIDPRQKERKKPGLKRARRAPQWQKR